MGPFVAALQLLALALVVLFVLAIALPGLALPINQRLALLGRSERGAVSMQVAPAQEAGRAQPQTTVEPPGGPFIRHSQPGRRAQYSRTGDAFGGLITQPLVAVPGYIRGYRLRFQGVGGTGGSAVGAADAPENLASLVTLRDPFGTVLIAAPGFEVFRELVKFGGQTFVGLGGDTHNLPTYSAITANGLFTMPTYLPLEFAKAYGVLSGANASLLPTLQINYAASGTFFSTPPVTTLPTINLDVDADFYWLPEGVQIEPPGLGTTCQWVLAQASPGIASAATAAPSLPRLGGFLTTLMLILRDSTSARIDGYGTRLRLYVDGVPLIDSRFDNMQDDIYGQFWGLTRETGVLPITRRTAMGNNVFGLFDTLEHALSTNPGTSIQLECSPWGTISNAPALLNVLAGQVVPSGALLQGLPEL